MKNVFYDPTLKRQMQDYYLTKPFKIEIKELKLHAVCLYAVICLLTIAWTILYFIG